MEKKLAHNGFPYTSYGAYISALAATEKIFTPLADFLRSGPVHLTGDSDVKMHQKRGFVTIYDSVDDRINKRQFDVGDFWTFSLALEQRPIDVQTRIIVIGYSRDLFNTQYYGLNKDTLDFLGSRYRLHPEVFLWHFTFASSTSDHRSEYTAFFDTANATFASPLSHRPFFHIQDHSSLISCCPIREDLEKNTGEFTQLCQV